MDVEKHAVGGCDEPEGGEGQGQEEVFIFRFRTIGSTSCAAEGCQLGVYFPVVRPKSWTQGLVNKDGVQFCANFVGQHQESNMSKRRTFTP